MARTTLTPVDAPDPYDTAAAAIPLVDGDATNGNDVVHTGREYIIARNTGASAATLTVHSSPDSFGREGDLSESIAAGDYVVTQVFPVEGWQQSDGRLHIDVSAVDIELVVVRLP